MTKAKKARQIFVLLEIIPIFAAVKQMLNPKSNGNETVDFS